LPTLRSDLALKVHRTIGKVITMTSELDKQRAAIVLEIGGQRIRLRAHADESHLVELARLVNERFASIQQSARNAPAATVLALVALDLADELSDAKRRAEEAKEQAKQAIAQAEARERELELLARRVIADAIEEIDRALCIEESARTASDSA
jgi:cell division protein ZapA (FtsZ GTPase activity inhibitor)